MHIMAAMFHNLQNIRYDSNRPVCGRMGRAINCYIVTLHYNVVKEKQKILTSINMFQQLEFVQAFSAIS